jgi:LysM repeat protein
MSANGMISNANRVYVGQSLLIPAPSTPPISDDAQAVQPPIANTPEPNAATTSYTVKAGDSAFSIARQFGVTLDALLAENSVTNRNRVYVGQVLSIPW